MHSLQSITKPCGVPEYAREYLEKNGKNYSYDDLLTIAKGQIDGGRKVVRSRACSRLSTVDRQLLFIDTDMYVMKVWCEFAFENAIAGY